MWFRGCPLAPTLRSRTVTAGMDAGAPRSWSVPESYREPCVPQSSWSLSDLILVRSCCLLSVQKTAFTDFQYCSFVLCEWLCLWHGVLGELCGSDRETHLAGYSGRAGTPAACPCFPRVLRGPVTRGTNLVCACHGGLPTLARMT